MGACRCVFQKEDDTGRVGVALNRDLVKVAGKALERNLTVLGPLVLPLSEKLWFAVNYVRRKILGHQLRPYVPNFKKAFDHFCLHAGRAACHVSYCSRGLGAPLISDDHAAGGVPWTAFRILLLASLHCRSIMVPW